MRQPLREAFVVSEYEQRVLQQGTPESSPELVPFKLTLLVLEVVLGIQSAVAVILEEVSMPLIRPGRGHNADLPSSPLAILGAIGVFEYVVFPHGLHAEQLRTGAGWCKELMGRIPSNPVDAVDQKPVGFLPMTRYGESGEIALVHVGRIIYNADVENQKLIEASPVQRQFLDLLRADQS